MGVIVVGQSDQFERIEDVADGHLPIVVRATIRRARGTASSALTTGWAESLQLKN